MAATTVGAGARSKSTASGIIGALLTLALFVLGFITFLVAPLLVLVLALLTYYAMRRRNTGRPAAPRSQEVVVQNGMETVTVTRVEERSAPDNSFGGGAR